MGRRYHRVKLLSNGFVAHAYPVIFTPLYHAGDAPLMAWHYMNWCIAPAVLVMLVASHIGNRRFDGEGSTDLKRYLEANTVFYGSMAASFIYFWNWFLALSPGNVSDGQFWSVLGAALPILTVVAGLRLWPMRTGCSVAG